MRKKKLKDSCLNNFFWPKIFTTNILCLNVYKLYECDKNQIPSCNIKSFKNSNLWEFWAIDGTWHTLDKFYYFNFHNEDNRYFYAYIKFGTKLFHLTWGKKVKCKIGQGKVKNKMNLKKGEFGCLWNESLWFKCGTPMTLGPLSKFTKSPPLIW